MPFPHAWTPLTRRRGTAVRGLAAAVTGVVSVAVLSSGPATALAPASLGSLEDQQDSVRSKLHQADDDVDESSALVRKATTALLQARADLAHAQTVLASTRDELAAAEALDREMQARLEAAQERLARARAALAEGRAAAHEQSAQLRQLAASTYEDGGEGLAGLSMVFTTQNPSLLAGRLNASSNMLNSQSALLDRLTAGRVVLDVQEQETADAEAQVARRREEAAANLERKQQLEAQAAAAADEVAHLVDVKAGARESALAVRRTDLHQQAKLEAEQARITALIEQQASTTSRLSAAVDGNGFLEMPTQGYVTSPFGWRIHPIFGYRSLHDGIDIGAGCGTPIVAPAAGTVLSEYFSTAWGNRIIIDHGVQHGVGLSTISNHLSSYAVPTGTHVARGQVVGYVGTTGWSTGCHLHFTVMQNGVPVDPMAWL